MRGRIAHDDELGIRYGRAADGALRAELPWAPFLTDEGGGDRIGAGPMVTILDTILGIGSMDALGFREAAATVDLRVDYIRRPAPGAGCAATAKAVEITGSEARGAVLMRAELREAGGGDLLALAFGHFIRRPIKLGEAGPLPLPACGAAARAGSYPALMRFDADRDGRLRLPYRPELVGNGALPSLHGGAVAAHLQRAATLRAERERPGALRLATASFTFLRFAGAADLLAEAEVERLGAAVSALRARSWQQEGRVNATGSFIFVRV